MSFKVYFSMSMGLAGPITVQRGTLARIKQRVSETEETLGLKVHQYGDIPPHWEGTSPWKQVDDEVYCRVAEEHNAFVHWLYHHIEDHADNPFPCGETITPEQLTPFWHGLREIDVPVQRWSRDFFVARMEEAYESLRGRGEAFTFDDEPLTERQAAQVIHLFCQWLDVHDCRPDVPVGGDHLACLDDGGYEWCDRCGAVMAQYACNCVQPGCPVKEALDTGEEEVK